MWEPRKPIVKVSRTLSEQEAWWREFIDEFTELCGGEVDREWLVGLAGTLYPLNADHAPREIADVAFVTLGYEPPGYELEETLIPPPRRRRAGLH